MQIGKIASERNGIHSLREPESTEIELGLHPKHPPTLMVGPNGPFSDLRFTLTDPRIPRVCPSIQLICTGGGYCSLWKSIDCSDREGWWTRQLRWGEGNGARCRCSILHARDRWSLYSAGSKGAVCRVAKGAALDFSCVNRPLRSHSLQGFLAHKKLHPPRTLQ